MVDKADDKALDKTKPAPPKEASGLSEILGDLLKQATRNIKSDMENRKASHGKSESDASTTKPAEANKEKSGGGEKHSEGKAGEDDGSGGLSDVPGFKEVVAVGRELLDAVIPAGDSGNGEKKAERDGEKKSERSEVVTENIKGQDCITEVKHPDGKSTTIAYDQNDPPKPATITRPDGSEWQREGDDWYEYKDGKLTGETLHGKFEFQKDGDIIKKDSSGKEVGQWLADGNTWDLDRPGVMTDSSRGTTSERYAGRDGAPPSTYTFKDGQLTEAQTADGESWKKTSDGKWQQYKDGNPYGDPQDVEMKVSPNGDCVVSKDGEVVEIKHRDGSVSEIDETNGDITTSKDGHTTEIVHADDSYTRFNADNSSVTRDQDQRLVEAQDKDGKVARHVEYDPNPPGNPTKIVDGTDVYEVQKDGSWNLNGGPWPVKKLDVTPDGGIRHDWGDFTLTHNLDDSFTKTLPDHSSCTTRIFGDEPLVTEVTDASGKTRRIDRDDRGHATRITETTPGGEPRVLLAQSVDGKQLMVLRAKSGGGEEWVPVTGKIGATDEGDIGVETSDGLVVWTHDGTRAGTTQTDNAAPAHTDKAPPTPDQAPPVAEKPAEPKEPKQHYDADTNTMETEFPDRSKVFDRDGKVTEVRSPDGQVTRVVYGNDGQPSQIIEPDLSRWIKGPDGNWNHFKNAQVIDSASQLAVGLNGDFNFLGKDGSRWTEHPNGSRTDFNEDASGVTRDKNHRLIEAFDKDGKVTRHVDYDPNPPGNPTKIVDGTDVYEVQKDGSWTMNGSPSGFKGIEITPEGGIEVHLESETLTHNLDNTYTTTYPDHTSYTGLENGTLTDVTDANGKTRHLEYDADGHLTRMIETAPGGEPRELVRTKDGKLEVLLGEKWVAATGVPKIYTDGNIYVPTSEGSIAWTRDGKSEGDVVKSTEPAEAKPPEVKPPEAKSPEAKQTEPKSDTKTEPKSDTKTEPKSDTKVEAKPTGLPSEELLATLTKLPADLLKPELIGMLTKLPTDLLKPELLATLTKLPADFLKPSELIGMLAKLPADLLKPELLDTLTKLPADLLKPELLGTLAKLPAELLKPELFSTLAKLPPDFLKPELLSTLAKLPPDLLKPESATKPEGKRGDAKVEDKSDAKPRDSKPEATLPPERKNPDGSVVYSDGKHVTKVVDAHGVTRTFNYGPDGKVNEVTEPSGTWKTTDGTHWLNEKGEKWEGTVDVATDGTYDSTKPSGEHIIRYTNGSERRTDKDGIVLQETATDGTVRKYTYREGSDGKPVVDMEVTPSKDAADPAAVDKAVDQIYTACYGKDGSRMGQWGRSLASDHEAVYKALDGQPPAVRKAIEARFAEKYDLDLRKTLKDALEWRADKAFELLDKKSMDTEEGLQEASKLVHDACQTPPPKPGEKDESEKSLLDKWGPTEWKNTFSADYEKGERIHNLIDKLNDMSEKDRHLLDDYYQKTYHKSLKDELSQSKELHGTDKEYALLLLDRKDGETIERPKSKYQKELEAVDRDKIKEKAKILHEELGKTLSIQTDKDKVFNTLKELSDAERDVLEDVYKEEYPDDKKSLSQAIKDQLHGEDETKALNLLNRDDSDFHAEGVNSEAMEAASESIYKAIHGGLGIKTDYDSIFKVLEGKTEKEREIISNYYKQDHGINLEQEFKDHATDAKDDKAYNLLTRKDGSADDAGFIHTALIERGQWVEGRSDETCEKDIRTRLSTMNSEQIAQLERDWEDRYPGKSLRDSLVNDEHLSDKTKDAIKIYLQGSDKIDDDDRKKLVDNALANKDIEMFQEAMRGDTPELKQFRKEFMDNGGEERLKKAFEGHWYNAVPILREIGLLKDLADGEGWHPEAANVTDTDLRHATDYGKEGKLRTVTKIEDNYKFYGDNEKAIEQAIHDMSEEERAAYRHGKDLAASNRSESGMSDSEKEDLKFYKELYNELKRPGNDAEVLRWDDMIIQKDGGLVSKLASHAANTSGHMTTDSRGDILKDIENMNDADWKYAKEHPEYRDRVKAALEELKGVRLDGKDVDRALQMYDQKMSAEPSQAAIDKAIAGMQEPERQAYLKGQKLAEDSTKPDKLSEDNKKALDYYQKVKESLTYDAAMATGRRSLTEALADDTHWYGNDRQGMLQSVAHMTLDDQENYRNNPDFKKKVDAALNAIKHVGLGTPDYGYSGARRMLDRIQEGKSPEDIVTKIYARGQERYDTDMSRSNIPVVGGLATSEVAGDALLGSSVAPVVRDMEAEFKADPTLRDRLNNPQTDEDKQLAKDFNEAIHKVVKDDDDYNKYIKPLLKDGRLPVDVQMELDKGIIKNDVKGAIDDILKASPEERDKILKDETYREKAIGYLSKEDQAIAIGVLKQTSLLPPELATGSREDRMAALAKIRTDKDYREQILGGLSKEEQLQAVRVLTYGPILPEDKIRMSIDHWGGSSDIMSALKDMKAKGDYAAIEEMKNAYTRKYGGDLTADLVDKLDGNDKAEATSILIRPASSSREQFSRDLDTYLQSYDGAGKGLVNNCWDGTGYMTEDAANQYAAKMTEYSAQFKTLPPEQQKELREKLESSLQNFRESKEGAAGAAFDVIIAAVAIGGAAFTDGVSLGLLAGTAAGGAALKVLINQVIMGSDYKWDFGNVSKDAVMGAVNGVLNVLGPGEVGELLKVGETAAIKATTTALKEGAEQLIKEGGETLLKKELSTAVSKAITDGSFDVSGKSLDDIVNKVAKEGASAEEKAALKQTLQKSLKESLETETRSWLEKAAVKAGFEASGAGAGGGVSSLAEASFKWDSSKSLEENLAAIGKAAAMGTVGGAIGGGAFSVTFHVGGEVFHGIKEKFSLKPGQRLSQEQLDQLGKDIGKEKGLSQVVVEYDKNGDLHLEGDTDRKAILPDEPKEHPTPSDKHGDDTSPPSDKSSDKSPAPKQERAEEKPTPKQVRAEDKVKPTDGKGDTVPSGIEHEDTIPPPAPTERTPDLFPQKPRAGELPTEVKEHPQLDYARIPLEEREVIFDRAKSHPLYDSASVKEFVDQSATMMKKWDNQTHVLDDAAKSLASLEKAEKSYNTEVKEPLRAKLREEGKFSESEIKKLTDDPEWVRKQIADEHQLETLDSFVEARRVHEDNENAVDIIAHERAGQIQDMFDKYAESKGLPKPQIVLEDIPGGGGYYRDGKLHLDKSTVIANKEPAKLIDTMYHEFAHHEQDSLIIRMLAEENKIGHPPTAEQLQALHEKYKKDIGQDVSDDHLKEVLRAGDSQPPLSDEQVARAVEMIDGWKNIHQLGESYRQAEVDMSAISGEIEKLQHSSSAVPARDLIEKLSQDDGKLCKQLFGTSTPPEDIQKLIESYKRWEKREPGAMWVESDAKNHLMSRLGDRHSDLDTWTRNQYRKYIDNELEHEAWVIGRKAQLEAQRSGLAGEPISSELATDLDAGTPSMPGHRSEVPKAKPGPGDSTDTGPKTKRGVGDETPAPGADTGPKTKRGVGDETPAPGADTGPKTKRGLGDEEPAPGADDPPPTRRSPEADDPPPTRRSPDSGRSETVKYDKPTTVTYEEPTSVTFDDPTTVRYDEPATVRYDEPTTVRYQDATTVRYEDHATVRYEDRATVRYEEPVTVRYEDPVTVRYEAGTVVTVDGPHGPETIKYDEPTTVRYDEPVTVRYQEHTTVTTDGPVTVRLDEPVTVRYDDPITVRYDERVTVTQEDPTTVRYDEPATLRYDRPTTIDLEEPTTVTTRDGRIHPRDQGPSEVSPRIKEVLDLADLLPEERKALLDLVSANNLAKPEVAAQFRADATEAMRNWGDVSHISGEAKQRVLDQRTAQLQKVMDDLSDANGMPRVKVEVGESGVGSGYYQDGRLRLSEGLVLSGRDPEMLKETMYHEFAHSQQDTLMLRKFVDDFEASGGKPLSEQEIKELQHLVKLEKEGRTLPPERQRQLEQFRSDYEQMRQAYLGQVKNPPLSDEHLLEVLRTRNGQKLTPDEAAHAENLTKAFGERKPPDKDFNGIVNNRIAVQAELNQLDHPGGALNLVDRLAKDDGTLARQLFGSDKLPESVQGLVDTYRKISGGEHLTWPDDYAKSVLKADLDHSAELLDMELQGIQKEYLGLHEQEAFILGKLARGDELPKRFKNS